MVVSVRRTQILVWIVASLMIMLVVGDIGYLEAAEGDVEWIYKASIAFNSDPTIGQDGTIYIGTMYSPYAPDPNQCGLYAINPDGTQKWFISFKSNIWDTSIGSDGTVYVQAGNKSIFAIDPNGTVK